MSAAAVGEKHEVVTAIANRQAELTTRLSGLDDRELRRPSLLPNWSRLTILCHLRYGARATQRLIRSTVVGETASFYPGGRDRVRPATLVPESGEDSRDVVDGLEHSSRELEQTLAELDQTEWNSVVREPSDNTDLGPVQVEMLALLRLTEVEVHGTDLNIGADPWSDTFVDRVLPMRLGWLSQRRSNDRSADTSIEGRWLLRSSDGPSFAIGVGPAGVVVDDFADDADPGSAATITASKRELLAFILGRFPLGSFVAGERESAGLFLRAFPPP